MNPSRPRYDDAMRTLCAVAPHALCRWLGVAFDRRVEPIRLSDPAPASPDREVDALVAVGDRLVVHLEFQPSAEAFFGWRMLDHRSLLVRRPELRDRLLFQHAVVLGPDRVDDGVYDNQVAYGFTVHYVRDQPVEQFLFDPELAPFAALARLAAADRPTVLGSALDLIATVTDDRTRRALAQAAVDLAALRLHPDVIRALWEDSAMPIPSLLNDTYDEGRADGRREARAHHVASALRHRFGPDERIDAIAEVLADVDFAEVLRRVDTASALDELDLRADTDADAGPSAD